MAKIIPKYSQLDNFFNFVYTIKTSNKFLEK